MPRPKRTKVGPSMAASEPAILQNSAKQHSTETGFVNEVEDGQRTGKITKQYWKSTPPRALAPGQNNRGPSERDHIGEKDKSEESEHESGSPEFEIGRRGRERLNDENSILAFGNLRRRQRQPSILGRGSKARSSTIDPDLAETRLPSLLRVDNSILAMSAIRRRPRQPSILGKGIRARSSSVGLDMAGSNQEVADSSQITGPSRKSQRQPKVLSVIEKDQQGGSENDSAEEDGFDPEDESTPMKLSNNAIAPVRASESDFGPFASRSRKRKLPSPRPPIEALPPLQHVNSDIDESLSTRSSPAPSPNRSITPEPLSETMAPPQSSSSGVSSREEVRHSNTIGRAPAPRLATRRQPLRKAQFDDPPSSPPSLTHSPNQSTTKARKRPKSQPSQPTVTTAQLQAQLPKRRRRQGRNTFDILSSDEEEADVPGLGIEDDGQSHLTLRTSRNSTRPIPARHVTKLKSGGKDHINPSRSAKASQHTYGSCMASDKENEGEVNVPGEEVEEGDSLGPIPDESVVNSQELEEKLGKELKKAKRKFENVDKWELEFEDFTAGSSSPQDAR